MIHFFKCCRIHHIHPLPSGWVCGPSNFPLSRTCCNEHSSTLTRSNPFPCLYLHKMSPSCSWPYALPARTAPTEVRALHPGLDSRPLPLESSGPCEVSGLPGFPRASPQGRPLGVHAAWSCWQVSFRASVSEARGCHTFTTFDHNPAATVTSSCLTPGSEHRRGRVKLFIGHFCGFGSPVSEIWAGTLEKQQRSRLGQLQQLTKTQTWRAIKALFSGISSCFSGQVCGYIALHDFKLYVNISHQMSSVSCTFPLNTED